MSKNTTKNMAPQTRVITTKEDERKALAKIKAIVDGLGEDSYVAAAFEGCFEIAEENITNDWACSMLDRAESAEARVDELEINNRSLRDAISKLTQEAANTEQRLKDLKAKNDMLISDHSYVTLELERANARISELEQSESNNPNLMRLMSLGAVMCDSNYDREAKKTYLKQEVKDGIITTEEAIDLVVEFM